MLTLDKIYHAAFVLRDVARRTDLIAASRLNSASDLYLKTENLQVTGSFKVRGAYYKISQLTAEERAWAPRWSWSRALTMTPMTALWNCRKKQA